jgi:GDP-4-dehydro-6-deoxy-D-mannose reductase
MKRCLITGCSGFIGPHLADFLIRKGLTVYGTIYQNTDLIEHLRGKAILLECDFKNKEAVEQVVKEVKPEYVFHLAAQSLVIPSWEDPENTFRTNIFGTLYLLDAIRSEGINPLIEVACSSAEYGLTYERELPIKENKDFRPTSPYGVSKVSTDMLAYLYWLTFRMKIIRIRPFNITGPGKTGDAASDFARGIAEIEAGHKRVLEVGNLEPIRDILDIRDALKAIWLLAEKGNPGEVYNICSGKGYKIKEVLNHLLSLSKEKIAVHHDSRKIRPMDEPVYIGDNFKICALGWKPEIPLSKTLSDILDYWRRRI